MSNVKLLVSVENVGLGGESVTVPISTGVEVSVLESNNGIDTYGTVIEDTWGRITVEVPYSDANDPDLLFLEQDSDIIIISRDKVDHLIEALFRLKVEVMDK